MQAAAGLWHGPTRALRQHSASTSRNEYFLLAYCYYMVARWRTATSTERGDAQLEPSSALQLVLAQPPSPTASWTTTQPHRSGFRQPLLSLERPGAHEHAGCGSRLWTQNARNILRLERRNSDRLAQGGLRRVTERRAVSMTVGGLLPSRSQTRLLKLASPCSRKPKPFA